MAQNGIAPVTQGASLDAAPPVTPAPQGATQPAAATGTPFAELLRQAANTDPAAQGGTNIRSGSEDPSDELSGLMALLESLIERMRSLETASTSSATITVLPSPLLGEDGTEPNILANLLGIPGPHEVTVPLSSQQELAGLLEGQSAGNSSWQDFLASLLASVDEATLVGLDEGLAPAAAADLIAALKSMPPGKVDAAMNALLGKAAGHNRPPEFSIVPPLILQTSGNVGAAQTAIQLFTPAGQFEESTIAALNNVVVRQIRSLSAQGESSVRIRLIPPSLGELRVDVTSNHNGVLVRLASANPMVRDMLEGQLDALRNNIVREGTNVTGISVLAHFASGQPGAQSDRRPEFSIGRGPAHERNGGARDSAQESVVEIVRRPAVIHGSGLLDISV